MGGSQGESREVAAGTGSAPALAGRWLALGLATIAFSINFWAWYLLSPLAKDPFGKSLDLTSFQIGLLVAMPILVGSLGRIPIGALTDRYGGKVMFAYLSFAVIVPVLYLSLSGVQDSYGAMLVGAFFLGLGGTSFAVGIPYVSQWFPAEKRGLALGIYGMGNIGTAISVRFTPKLYGKAPATTPAKPFYAVAIALAIIAIAFLVAGRESPNRTKPATSFWARLTAAGRLGVTWDLAFLYFITFGAFVAFGAYLPTFFGNLWHLDKVPAGNWAALFVVVATLARPIGGWVSDKMSGAVVASTVLVIAALGAVYLAFHSTPVKSAIDQATGLASAVPIPTAIVWVLVFVAACLGLGNGAIFALVGKRVAPAQAGSVSGIVGAAGGFGGYFPTLIMAYVFGRWTNYEGALLALAVMALLGAVYAATVVRKEPAAPA
jgi:NNP family nitrate/nitrite transporter-like MFS transporter